MKLNALTPFLLSVLLLGCGSTPSSVIIAPQISTVKHTVYNNQSIQLKIEDLRRQHHVIQVLKKDKAATLYSPANDLATTLNSALTTAWHNQGLKIDSFSDTSVNIFIDAALVSVQQETVKYQANSEIRLRIQVTKGEKTLTNNFKSTGASNGPLFADIAVLERDFNQQLGKVIGEVLKNQDMQDFINH